jgi:hypothetical protein
MTAETVHASALAATVSVQDAACSRAFDQDVRCLVPVRLSRALVSAVDVHFATRAGSATAEDFVPVTDAVVRIPAGSTSVVASVVQAGLRRV